MSYRDNVTSKSFLLLSCLVNASSRSHAWVMPFCLPPFWTKGVKTLFFHVETFQFYCFFSFFHPALATQSFFFAHFLQTGLPAWLFLLLSPPDFTLVTCPPTWLPGKASQQLNIVISGKKEGSRLWLLVITIVSLGYKSWGPHVDRVLETRIAIP